jgi:hypothetical protein
MMIEKVNKGDPITASHTNKVIEAINRMSNLQVSGASLSTLGGFHLKVLRGGSDNPNIINAYGDPDRWFTDSGGTPKEEKILRMFSVMRIGGRGIEGDGSDEEAYSPSAGLGFKSDYAGSSVVVAAAPSSLGAKIPLIYAGVSVVAYDPASIPDRTDSGAATSTELKTGDRLGPPILGDDPVPSDLKAQWDLNGEFTVIDLFVDSSGNRYDGYLLSDSGWDEETTRLALVSIGQCPRGGYIMVTGESGNFLEVCHTLVLGNNVSISASGNGWIELSRS